MADEEKKKVDLRDLDGAVNVKAFIVQNKLMKNPPGNPETEIYFEEEKVILFRDEEEGILWVGYQFEQETDLLEAELYFDLYGRKKILASLDTKEQSNETQVMISKDFPVKSFKVVTNVEYDIRIFLNGFTYEPFSGLKIEKIVFKNNHSVAEPLIEEYEIGKTL